MSNRRIVVGVTGASGAVYARRLLECLGTAGVEIHLIISPKGGLLLADELGIAEPSPETLVGPEVAKTITAHAHGDVGACVASGSFMTDGMVICPCSSNTLADVAAGAASNLISRAAAVHLKEARRLVLLPREMPVSQIDMRNMLRVSKAGGIICPASPGFYMRPRSVADLVDFVAGRLCDLLGVKHSLDTRWVEGVKPNHPQ
ncbi:MAG: UbiX family flavin prenyltransferase [Phycisphaerae bacterium]|nr:UbiX family flavin prenyltransferase [Phycisphaerae bacterium]